MPPTQVYTMNDLTRPDLTWQWLRRQKKKFLKAQCMQPAESVVISTSSSSSRRRRRPLPVWHRRNAQ